MNVLFELRRYRTLEGRIPYSEWIGDLDSTAAARISAHVDRIKTGNFGNTCSVGDGVLELKINYGSGYRVYYVRDHGRVVILLCGGDKGSQQIDIRRAHGYAEDYWRRR